MIKYILFDLNGRNTDKAEIIRIAMEKLGAKKEDTHPTSF